MNAGIQTRSSSAIRPSIGHIFAGQEYQSPLAALSLAAEQTAFQDALAVSSAPTYTIAAEMLTETFVDAGAQPENMPQSVDLVDQSSLPWMLTWGNLWMTLVRF